MISGILAVIAASCIVLILLGYVIRDLIHYHRLDKYSKEREKNK